MHDIRCSGTHVAVYFVAIKYMSHTSSLLTPQNRLWLILSAVLFVSATAGEALQIRWSWDAEWRLGASAPPANLARVVLLMIMSWTSDCILLTRFSAITRRKLTTMALPSAMIISSIVVSSTYLPEIAGNTSSVSIFPNTSIILCLSLSCGLNVYLTTHIVCYMVKLTPRCSTSRATCHRIASFFVQSALLHLVPTLIFIALCAKRNVAQDLLFPIMCQIQPLPSLLVIMRVAESRLLKKESSVITTDDIFSISVPHKPRLSIKLNFRPLDIEEGEKEPETPTAPTPQLPEPLPTIKIKLESPSSAEMLDSKQTDELWKSQDSRRASCLTSPSSSSSSWLPTYTPCWEDLNDGELRLFDPPGEVNTQNDHNDPPEQSPNHIFHQC